ncbi:MAG: tyrosine-type recombinase/integrase [Deltaproteobacteria bacterium]|nr:tyrosine-type recombinase/integrase [Deltaproteobacteria bacterium]
MFNLAVEDGHAPVNPAVRILRRSRVEEGAQQKNVTFLTREETIHLLETCRAHFPSSYPLMLLLVRTGLRIGEAFALQWGDIDFHGRFAEVQRTFSNGRLSTPKNNRSRRVDLSLRLTDTLNALLLERKKETLRISKASRSRMSRSRWGTILSRSPWTPTATWCPEGTGKRWTGWTTRTPSHRQPSATQTQPHPRTVF